MRTRHLFPECAREGLAKELEVLRVTFAPFVVKMVPSAMEFAITACCAG